MTATTERVRQREGSITRFSQLRFMGTLQNTEGFGGREERRVMALIQRSAGQTV